MAETTDFGDLDDIDLAWLRAKAGSKWSKHGPDVLPAWVADMDFAVAAEITDALARFVASGDFGYPDFLDGTPLRVAFTERMETRYGWAPDPALTREFNSVVQAFEAIVDVITEPGEPVAVHVPCYSAFLKSLAAMSRPVVGLPLRLTDSAWRVDLEATEAALATSRCRVLALVHPHNPTGHVFTPAELDGLAEIARRLDLVVLSDEIHAELTYAPARHHPFAARSTDAASRTVTMSSATKAFNLAGIRTCVVHLGDERVRSALATKPPHLYGAPSPFGVVATLAAWEQGSAWQDQVVRLLDRNRYLLAELLAEHVPLASYLPPEATYLAWIDMRTYDFTDDPAASIRERAAVQLSPGPDYGTVGDGHIRLNFATSGSILREIVHRIGTALPPL